MKIAWLTPFSARSAIGEFSKWVCEELSRSARVEIWTGDDGELHSTSLPIVRFKHGAGQARRLAAYDHRVYNFGDHYGFHGVLYEASRRQPGVAILHDRVYQNLFAPYWLSRRRADVYVGLMEELYGAEGRIAAERSVNGIGSPVWESPDETLRFPLFEEAIADAAGVITHARDHADLVRKRWLGPVSALFLPSYPSDAHTTRAVTTDATEPTRLVSVGYVNRNKQVHRVVEALASSSELTSRCVYQVIGPLDENSAYVRELRALIDSSELGGTVELLGFQPDDTLQDYMARADVFVNLRDPPMEGASASLMRQLMWAKPTVVNSEGSFAEIPDDAAVKIREEDGLLAAELLKLAKSAERRAAIGSAGHDWARSRSVERYAREFLDFENEVRSWRPVLRVCDRIGRELGAMGVDPRLGAVDEIAAELTAILPLEDGP